MSQHTSKQSPPIAPAHPHTHITHSDQRTDPYFWLKDRNDPAVIAYLEAENAYAESWLKHTEPLRENLVEEMYRRIVETDTSVPVKRGQFEYYSRDEQQETTCLTIDEKLATRSPKSWSLMKMFWRKDTSILIWEIF